MKRTFFVGLAIAAIGGLGLFIASALGLTLTNTIVGVGGGVVAATAAIGTPLHRLIGFLIGFVLGMFFTSMLLGLIPGGQSVVGQAVALAVVLVIIALIHGFTREKIQHWIMLLGLLTFAAGVYPTMITNPSGGVGNFWAAVGTQLTMAMIGFLCIIPATLFPDRTSLTAAGASHGAAPEPHVEEEPELEPHMVTPAPSNEHGLRIMDGE